MTIKTNTQSKKGASKASGRRGPGPRAGEWLPWVGGAVVIVLLATVVFWWIKKQYPDDTNTHYDPVLATVGKADAPVTLDVYEDFMCPACAGFEAGYGDQVAQATAGGKLRVQYHMLNFLNRNSASGDYSSRAAGAAKAVFDKAPGKFLDFHTKLFEKGIQPQEGSAADLTNDDLAKIAEQVGAGAASADIRSGADVQAASGSARVALRQLATITGNVSTPSIIKDGKPVDWQSDPQWLAKLLGSPAPAPAPAPTR